MKIKLNMVINFFIPSPYKYICPYSSFINCCPQLINYLKTLSSVIKTLSPTHFEKNLTNPFCISTVNNFIIKISIEQFICCSL